MMVDFICAKCGASFEHFFHRSEMPDEIPCEVEGCEGRAPRTLVLKRRRSNAQPFSPVLLFRKPDGSYSFPGVNDAPTPEGCQRVELRTVDEVRKLEREVNRIEYARHEEAHGREEAFYAELQSRNRSELRAAMQHMSPAGRDFALEAMRRNDERSRPRFEPGFNIEIFSQDSSNREDYRDQTSGWRGRKD